MPPRSSHPLLLGEEIDDGIRRLRIELARVRAVEPTHAAREFDDRDLHAEADPQVRNLSLPRDLHGEDLALDRPAAKPAGHEDSMSLLKSGSSLVAHRRIDPAQPHGCAADEPRMLERLGDREVGVVDPHVLADQDDLDLV